MSYDAVIVGSGVNSLACGALLAQLLSSYLILDETFRYLVEL